MAEAQNYLDIIEKNRSGGVEHAATVPVFYESGPRRRLTKKKRRALLQKSASDGKRGRSDERKKTSRSKRKSQTMATKKQKAAARRNIKKAQAAKRAKAAARSRAGKKAARTKATRKAARRSSAKRSARKAARKAPKRSSKRRAKSRSKSRKSTRRSSKRRTRKTKRSMSMRVPRKTKKVYVVAAEKPRKRRKSRRSRKAAEKPRRSRRRGSSRRRGAMENPMTGVELFVGSITGLFGFGVADAVDRMLATHALTDKNAKDANGYELYADNPPTDGDYPGLFNATAVCSPMNAWRWGNAVAIPALLFGGAHFVSAPTLRSSLQFFAFGYGIRGVGKGLIDAMAALTVHTGTGQRLYDGEMRAGVLKANNGNNQADALASLPSAGLGKPQLAAPCTDCGDKQVAKPQGAGWPSMPVSPGARSTSTPANNTANTPPANNNGYPPPPPPSAEFNPGPLTGTPKNGVRKDPYHWGVDSPDYRE
jgi:hypothetical protein